MLDALTRAAEAYSQQQRLEIGLVFIAVFIFSIVASSAGMWKK